jgi:hypothetical protein
MYYYMCPETVADVGVIIVIIFMISICCVLFPEINPLTFGKTPVTFGYPDYIAPMPTGRLPS